MEKHIRKLTLLVAIALLLSALPTAMAADIQPRYSYIDSFRSTLTFDSDGYAVCYGKVNTTTVLSVKIVCKLQKNVSGSWLTLKTWTNTGNTQAQTSQKYAISSGATYRVYTVAYVLDSNGNVLEEASMSDTHYYP